MKKILTILLAAIMLVGVTGCDNNMFKDYEGKALTNALRAYELNQLVEKEYYISETKFAYHYYPNINADDGNLSTAFAWPYTEMVASNYRIGTLSKKSLEGVKDFYISTLEGFEYYRSFRSDYHCYVASRAAEIGKAGGDTYYDDNVWISREFLNAYELLGDAKYLSYSENVGKYIWSGWAGDELRGIYWKEQGKASRNTCSNAPAVILFSRLYETTKNEDYLVKAKKIYDFCYETLRDPSDNVYWDSVHFDTSKNEDVVDKRDNWKFTYNTGSMIAAGVKLYEITKDEKYLSHAKASALGASEQWFVSGDRGYKEFTSANSWFNVLLLDGFTELYKYDKAAYDYIKEYEANLDYAYNNFRCDAGFMSNDWRNGFRKDSDNKFIVKDLNVLDMAANAENFGHLAHFYKNVYKG